MWNEIDNLVTYNSQFIRENNTSHSTVRDSLTFSFVFTFVSAKWVTITNYGVDYIQLTGSELKNCREISFSARNILYTVYV